MVKKTTIFDKLRSRWRSPTRMRLDRDVPGGDRRPDGAVARAEVPAEPEAERVSGRKLSAREEVVVALGEGFQELSGLVRGVQSRMEGQSSRLDAMAKELEQLPALGRAQLELLRQLATQLERQNEVGEQMAATFSHLPKVLEGVQGALNRAAATDERTAKTLAEFRGTMDRVQTHMSRLVEHSETQARATAELVRDQQDGAGRLAETFQQERKREAEQMQAVIGDLGRSQKRTVEDLREVTERGLESIRRTQEDHATKLSHIVERTSRWNRALLVLAGLSLAALLGILVVLATR